MDLNIDLRRATRILATLLASSALMPHAVLAQEAAGTDPVATADAAPGIGDIVVTARKQAENLQDVPLTITAFTSESIEKTDTKNVFDLATRTPGLYFGTTGGRNGGNKLQIRNLSTGTSGGSKASVFIDGVFVSGDYSSTALANLDRIEVLKGPQSAYFGRSTFSGAVNFITKDPGAEFEGRVEAIAATLGEYDISGYVTTPIAGEMLSNTISARYFEFRGPDYWVNSDGYHLGDQRTFAVTDKLVFRPTDALTIRAYGSYVRDRDHIPQTSYAPLSTRNLRVVRPDGTVSYYYQGEVNIEHSRATAAQLYQQRIRGFIDQPGVSRHQYRGVLSFDWEVQDHNISGFAAFGDEKLRNNFDAFYLGARIESAPDARDVVRQYQYNSSNFSFYQRTKDRQYEIRLTSPSDWRLRYLLGFNHTQLYGNTTGRFNPVRPDGTRANPIGRAALTTNNLNNVLGNPARTNGLFGALYFDVTDQLTVSAELRLQSDKITATFLPTESTVTGAPLPPLFPFLQKTFRSTLPRFNIQYKPTDDLQLYAIYSVGNNPGGFNTNVASAFLPAGVPLAYGEEKLKNFEAGLKSTWLDGKLLFNLAVYHMKWSPQHVLQTYVTLAPPPQNIAALTTATASSNVTGFEAEIEALPFEGLNLRATAGYGKAKYKEFCSSNYYALTGIATGIGCRSVKGFQQEGTPALQLAFFADYTRPITDTLNAYVRADYQYQSKVYLEEFNSAWIGAAHLAGLRLGVQNDNFTVEGFVRNLLDDDHSARITRATYQAVGGNNPQNIVPPQPPAGTTNYPSVPTPPGSAVASTNAGAAGNQSFADTARRPRQIGVRVAYKF